MFGFLRKKGKATKKRKSNAKRASSKKKRVIKTKVRGVTFHNNDGISRQKVLKELRKGEKLILKHSPIPGYPNAVSVSSKSGKQLGYLSDELSGEISKELRAGKKVTCKVLNKTGGGLIKKKTRGCNIKITIR